MSGKRSYHAGFQAEEQVARLYQNAGAHLCARRWRGKSGEIDLVLRLGGQVIFVEVKQSRTHAQAAESLSSRQIHRICQSACEFLGHEPEGQNSACRFDLATVDETGRIEILENAFLA